LLPSALSRLGFASFCLEATDGLPVGFTGDLAAMLGKVCGACCFGGLEVAARMEEMSVFIPGSAALVLLLQRSVPCS
jgi:hypothetical protein